ncbi:MAG: YggT family protein [Thermoanaerobaculia bacterium]
MEFLFPFFNVLLIVLDVLEYLILAWVILSWILFFLRQSKFRWRNPRAYAILEQLDDIFSRMTYPFLRPFRRLLRRVDTRGIDWSPLLLLLTIFIVRGVVAIAAGRILQR